MEKLTGQALADKWVETRSKFCETCGYPQARRPECTYSNGWYRYRRGDGSHHFHSSRAPNIHADIINWERRIEGEPARQAAAQEEKQKADKAWLITQAAPELLKVVEAVCTSGLVPEWSMLGKHARAALAKAKGEAA